MLLLTPAFLCNPHPSISGTGHRLSNLWWCRNCSRTMHVPQAPNLGSTFRIGSPPSSSPKDLVLITINRALISTYFSLLTCVVFFPIGRLYSRFAIEKTQGRPQLLSGFLTRLVAVKVWALPHLARFQVVRQPGTCSLQGATAPTSSPSGHRERKQRA